jgi:hypothetical protein
MTLIVMLPCVVVSVLRTYGVLSSRRRCFVRLTYVLRRVPVGTQRARGVIGLDPLHPHTLRSRLFKNNIEIYI